MAVGTSSQSLGFEPGVSPLYAVSIDEISRDVSQLDHWTNEFVGLIKSDMIQNSQSPQPQPV